MITMAGAHSSCSSRKGSNVLSEVLQFNWDTPVREPNSHRCHMTFTGLKKTEFWGAPRHWIGFWVKKKKKERKEKRRNNQTTSSNTSTECHQHQERPVQIGRHPFRNHTSFSSVLLLVVYSLTQRTFFFTPEAHRSCMHGRWWYSLRLSVTAGLSPRWPSWTRTTRQSESTSEHHPTPTSSKPERSCSFLSVENAFRVCKALTLSLFTTSISIPQALTAAQGETVSEENPRSTSRRDGINQATWDEHHKKKKLRPHENINESLASVRVGNSSTTVDFIFFTQNFEQSPMKNPW